MVSSRAALLAPLKAFGQVAQLVEQWTENPCVGGSIPSLSTKVTSLMELSDCN